MFFTYVLVYDTKSFNLRVTFSKLEVNFVNPPQGYPGTPYYTSPTAFVA